MWWPTDHRLCMVSGLNINKVLDIGELKATVKGHNKYALSFDTGTAWEEYRKDLWQIVPFTFLKSKILIIQTIRFGTRSKLVNILFLF